MNSPSDSIYHYWGKAQSDIETLADYHPLPYHCLDVTSVGQVLMEQHVSVRCTLASLLWYQAYVTVAGISAAYAEIQDLNQM